jgi:hypothetical protein
MVGWPPLVQPDQHIERADERDERRQHRDEYDDRPELAIFCRTSSSGPENRFAVRLMPAVSTLISVVEHITTSKTNAAVARAAM